MSKKITEFTFGEAKNASIQRISKIADFMENLNLQKPESIPIDWAIVLRTLELRIQRASSPCLKEWEVKQITELASQLCQANPDTSTQLMEFWKLYLEVLKNLKKDSNGVGYEIQGIIQDNWSEVENSDSNAENLSIRH